MGAGHQLKERRRARAALVVVASLGLPALAGGCRHEETETAVVDAGAATGVPVLTDRLAPGELVESKVQLLGLPVPVGMTVASRSIAEGALRGETKQQQVTSFFQSRVKGGKLFPGAHASDFRAVTAAGSPGRLLDIHVEQEKNGMMTDVTIRDVTPSDAAVLSRAEALKANGLSPDGKQLADPLNMQ